MFREKRVGTPGHPPFGLTLQQMTKFVSVSCPWILRDGIRACGFFHGKQVAFATRLPPDFM